MTSEELLTQLEEWNLQDASPEELDWFINKLAEDESNAELYANALNAGRAQRLKDINYKDQNDLRVLENISKQYVPTVKPVLAKGSKEITRGMSEFINKHASTVAKFKTIFNNE